MSVLLKSGEEFFEIPNEVLEQCRISKEQFEEGCREVSADVAGQGICVEAQMCESYKGYGASCGKEPCYKTMC